MTSDERRPASSNGWTSKGCMQVAEGTCQHANQQSNISKTAQQTAI